MTSHHARASCEQVSCCINDWRPAAAAAVFWLYPKKFIGLASEEPVKGLSGIVAIGTVDNWSLANPATEFTMGSTDIHGNGFIMGAASCQFWFCSSGCAVK